jgi:hypothetical protein
LVILTQGAFMNTDNIIPSILHVTAKTNLNIENDLLSEQTKTLAELIENNEEKNDEKSE